MSAVLVDIDGLARIADSLDLAGRGPAAPPNGTVHIVGDEAIWSGPSMGGRLEVRIAFPGGAGEKARRAAARVGRRVAVWESRLTRFSTSSDLARLNADLRQRAIGVRPTLGAVLGWAAQAEKLSGGTVDVTLLDARLTAEHPGGEGSTEPSRLAPRTARRWSVASDGRRMIVDRLPHTRFDLDGVAKGWIADRAAALLSQWPSVLVDADGDIALRVAPDVEWLVGIADPRSPEAPLLATLMFAGSRGAHGRFGIATSGTTVHRWRHPDGRLAHHLIDPRTERPAVTDVMQATVLGESARAAEVLAKSAVILGSVAGLRLFEASTVHAGILLTGAGEVLALPGTGAWLQ